MKNLDSNYNKKTISSSLNGQKNDYIYIAGYSDCY